MAETNLLRALVLLISTAPWGAMSSTGAEGLRFSAFPHLSLFRIGRMISRSKPLLRDRLEEASLDEARL